MQEKLLSQNLYLKALNKLNTDKMAQYLKPRFNLLYVYTCCYLKYPSIADRI